MMDVYEFSERDDQTYLQTKSVKQQKRKSREILFKNGKKVKNGRNKRNKLCGGNGENDNELQPPIKLKLIRDQADPHLFKSVQLITDVSHSSDITFDFDQQSLLRCKLSDGREFALNDIVWAKISGYPYWPSKILSLNLSTSNQKLKNCASQNGISKLDLTDEYIACVEWLAYDQISYVNCANLSHFHGDFNNKYSCKIKNKKYFEAVNEAKNLCEEDAHNVYHTVDSVQSCETTEADTSSTLPSHNFTSPESNQSVQSYCLRQPGNRSDSLSNKSDRSSQSILDHRLLLSDPENSHVTTDTVILSTNWELPDLGSNLDFESNNHIPEFSDYEDDCENIDIAKIEFMIDETHKLANK